MDRGRAIRSAAGAVAKGTGSSGSSEVWTAPVSAERLLREVDQAVIVSDRAGTIVFWNVSAERLYGWAAYEAVGRNVLDVMPSAQSAEQAGEIMERLVAGESWAGEAEAQRRDGSTFTALITNSPVCDDDGELTAVVSLSRDVSEIRVMEHALDTADARFQDIVNNSSDVLAVTDADAVIRVLAGPVEAIFGVRSESLIGASMFDLVRPSDRNRARRLWSHRTSTPDATQAQDFWIQGPDGGWVGLNVKTTNHLDNRAIAGVVVSVRDVTETRNRGSARRLIDAANAALVLARSEYDLFSEICRIVVADEAYRLAWVGIADPARPLGFRFVTVSGAATAYLDAIERTFTDRTDGPVRDVLESNRRYVVQDIEQMPESSPFRRLLLDHGHRSLVFLPLRFSEGEMGVLAVYSARTNAFSGDALGVLEMLADDVSYCLGAIRSREDRDHYRQRFEASLESAVRAIATAAELRDPYTAGHQRRVAELAQAIARVLGVDADLVTGIGVAASIHDIGKLTVPAEILSKPGRLSPAEYEVIKEHAQAGYDIVKSIDFPWPAADMILQHHERLDGSGYPNGLRGEEINLGARIIAVADTVEAMSSHRPYRPGLGAEAALETITDERGTLFHPDAVDACLQLFHDDGFTFTGPS